MPRGATATLSIPTQIMMQPSAIENKETENGYDRRIKQIRRSNKGSFDVSVGEHQSPE